LDKEINRLAMVRIADHPSLIIVNIRLSN
jgi:hypothetical protein